LGGQAPQVAARPPVGGRYSKAEPCRIAAHHPELLIARTAMGTTLLDEPRRRL
jgi:hypothetical protein